MKNTFEFILARPNTSIKRIKTLLDYDEKIVVLTITQVLRRKGNLLKMVKKLKGTDIFIKHNRVQCKHCKKTIESLFEHHRVYCSCHKCSVNGGYEWLDRTGIHNRDYKELSEFFI